MSPGDRPSSALERLRRVEAGQSVSASAGDRAGDPSGARRRGVVGGALVAVGLVLVKLKTVAFLLLTKLKFLLVALKLGKFLVTGWTMVLMAGVYAMHYGWRFAVGLVLLVLIHELGHALAARAMGMPVGAPVFIPFVGAMIALGRQPRSTWEDFVIAAGGPILGGLAAGACVVAAGLSGGDWAGLLLALGFFGLLMNLFNLTPFWSLDGARMLGVVSWRAGLWATGVSVLALVAIAWAAGHLNPVALIAVAVCAWRFGRHAWWNRRGAPALALERLRLREAERTAVPDHADATQRRIGLAVYFGTLLVLAAAAHAVFVRLPAV